MKSEQRRISVSPAQFKVRETNISTGPHDGGRSDRLRLVGTWRPVQCHEIDLVSGRVSEPIAEQYTWTPGFIDNETYLFAGETTLRARLFGTTESARASQPLVKEIRDAISEKGKPSLEVCGKVGDRILVIDYGDRDRSVRLLEAIEGGNHVRELASMKPCRLKPRFLESGDWMVYQGHQFSSKNTRDKVFLQSVEEGSEGEVLVPGRQSGTNDAHPLFWGEDRVLYIHRGTEVRSISLEQEADVEVHWPISINP